MNTITLLLRHLSASFNDYYQEPSKAFIDFANNCRHCANSSRFSDICNNSSFLLIVFVGLRLVEGIWVCGGDLHELGPHDQVSFHSVGVLSVSVVFRFDLTYSEKGKPPQSNEMGVRDKALQLALWSAV